MGVIRYFVTSLIFLLPAIAPAQSIYGVSIDTSRLRGTSGKLIFDITSNMPLTNRADVLNFYTDGVTGLPQTAGNLVAGDLIQNVQPAKLTRMKANTFFTELALPFETFGDEISFTLNVSETAPLPGRLPDEFALYLVDANGHPLMGRSGSTGGLPAMSVTVTGQRGGTLQDYEYRGQPTDSAGDSAETDAARSPVAQAGPAKMRIIPAWTPDNPAALANAATFEGILTEYCNRRCAGEKTCTGGAFGINLNRGDIFYSFDDVGNLKAQVAIVDRGGNPLTEGQFGRVKVTGTLSNSVLTVLQISFE
jgi:hypothetical protein